MKNCTLYTALLMLGALVVGTGCTGSQTPPRALDEPAPGVVHREGAEPINPELIPEALAGRIAILAYNTTNDRERTTVRMTIANETMAETITLEMCALFSSSAGEELFTTEWQRVELAGSQRFTFHAETGDPGVAGGVVLIRQVLTAGR